jgi:ligand-binding sensor domain-containing protein
VSSRYLVCLFILLSLFLPEPIARAQDLNYTHYTVESGLLLPSNEVYGILFDKNNILWATTDRGVWRYDGYNPRQYTVANGLRENANLMIFSDSLNRIWLSSLNNYLFRIINDSVYEHPMSRRVHEIGNNSAYVQQVTENKDGSIYLNFNRPGIIHLKTGEEAYKLTEHRKNHEGASIAIHYSRGKYYWDMIGFPDTNRFAKSKVTSEKGWVYLTAGLYDPKNLYRKKLYPIGDNEFIFSYANKLFHLKNGNLEAERSFTNNIVDLYVDKKGGFWAGLENEGVYRFPGGNLNSVPERYLIGETISAIAQDHEGDFWFATATNGIFQANTLDIAVYQNLTPDLKDNIITSMVSDGEHVYLGTQTGLLLKGSKGTNQQYKFHQIKNPLVNGPVRKLVFTNDNHLIVFNNNLLEIDTLGRYQGIKKIPSFPYDYILKPGGEWIASFTGVIRVIKDDRELRIWDEKTIPLAFPAEINLTHAINRVRSLFMDNHGSIWLGSQNSGLFSSRDSAIFSWTKKDDLFGKRIHDIIQAGDNIWVSIADYGLAIIRPDSSFMRITQKDGLSSDIIDVLFTENDSVIWAGTNNGLNRITFRPGDRESFSIQYFTMREGLPSNRIFQIMEHEKNIWICTTQGAIRLNPDFSKPLEIYPKLIPGPLLVNGIPRELNDTVILRPNENDLVFRFKAISYRKPTTLRYQFRLVGIDRETIETNGLESRYPDLKFGNYTFLINASYNETFDKSTERAFYIQIRKHWFETNLVLILAGALVAAIVFLIFRLILKTTKKRELEKRQLLNAEKRSLLSQMNPHFIFNSLNSIQHFIVQNDQFQANNYLASFSGLIRRILDNSKKNLIPLQEEISSLTLYLSMEKLRFENEFEYEIIRDPRIDFMDTMIPPMLVQPFVENAIWHGLMPLKTKGMLRISFELHDGFFHCLIEDNGIGREKAMLLKGKKEPHSSTGIQNVQERIELLNKMNRKKIRLNITDLRNPEGNASGTLVEIILPLLL